MVLIEAETPIEHLDAHVMALDDLMDGRKALIGTVFVCEREGVCDMLTILIDNSGRPAAGPDRFFSQSDDANPTNNYTETHGWCAFQRPSSFPTMTISQSRSKHRSCSYSPACSAMSQQYVITDAAQRY